jgi:hypothetical protein
MMLDARLGIEGRVPLLEDMGTRFVLPLSQILLRFPAPPAALSSPQAAAWQAAAAGSCISMTESPHAPTVWWLHGLSEAKAGSGTRSRWNAHEIHWASELYRAAFVEADPSWRPDWVVSTYAGFGNAPLGSLVLGSPASVGEPVRPDLTEILNVAWERPA